MIQTRPAGEPSSVQVINRHCIGSAKNPKQKKERQEAERLAFVHLLLHAADILFICLEARLRNTWSDLVLIDA